MVSKHVVEQADLVFESELEGIFYTRKNRFGLSNSVPKFVSTEFVTEMLNSDFKVYVIKYELSTETINNFRE